MLAQPQLDPLGHSIRSTELSRPIKRHKIEAFHTRLNTVRFCILFRPIPAQ